MVLLAIFTALSNDQMAYETDSVFVVINLIKMVLWYVYVALAHQQINSISLIFSKQKQQKVILATKRYIVCQYLDNHTVHIATKTSQYVHTV
jgi:hypothetical protein